MVWFAENKSLLQAEFPDLIAADLTKQAMRRYKTLKADGKDLTVASHKRKLTDDGSSETEAVGSNGSENAKISGVAKLARFGFAKN